MKTNLVWLIALLIGLLAFQCGGGDDDDNNDNDNDDNDDNDNDDNDNDDNDTGGDSDSDGDSDADSDSDSDADSDSDSDADSDGDSDSDGDGEVECPGGEGCIMCDPDPPTTGDDFEAMGSDGIMGCCSEDGNSYFYNTKNEVGHDTCTDGCCFGTYEGDPAHVCCGASTK